MPPLQTIMRRAGVIDFDSSGLILEEAGGKRWRLLVAQPLLIGEEVTVTGTASGSSTLVVREVIRQSFNDQAE